MKSDTGKQWFAPKWRWNVSRIRIFDGPMISLAPLVGKIPPRPGTEGENRSR